MGYMRHHTIVVCGIGEGVQDAHQKAKELFANVGEPVSPGSSLVSDITPPQVNGYCSFFIAPDGSKEGWSASDVRDEARAKFTSWLYENRRPLGYIDFVEVQFGDENCNTRIISGPGETLEDSDSRLRNESTNPEEEEA